MKIKPRAFRPSYRDLEAEQAMLANLDREYRTPNLANSHRSALNSALQVHVKRLSRRTRLVVRAAIERQILRQHVQRHSTKKTSSSPCAIETFHAELDKIQARIELESQAAQRECMGLSQWLEHQERLSAPRRDQRWTNLQRTMIAKLSDPFTLDAQNHSASLTDTVILCRDGLSQARNQALQANDAEHLQRLAYLKRRCTEMKVALQTVRSLFKRLRAIENFDPARPELFAAIQGPLNEEQSLQMRWSALVSIFRSNLALQPSQAKPWQRAS